VGWFFQSPAYRREIAKSSSGIGINNLRRTHIEEMGFVLPPLPEQRRIVAKIEELFSQLDAGVEELKKAKAQLKRYRQSVLKAAFDGKLTEGWRKKNLTTKTPRHKEDSDERQKARTADRQLLTANS